MEKQRKPGGRVIQVRDQNFGSRFLSKQGFGQILLGDGSLTRLCSLVFGELENELSDERDVLLRRRNYARFAGSAIHRRIIRLAESGVNAIFRA